ncbi:MAG TPA: hypothetical protein VMT20_23670 [Terriglobia bacterium]|nr:hypothetical protein [Terriglobia bacterium]
MPLRFFLTTSFRKLYAGLPPAVQNLADEKYRLFKQDPFHPSLEFQAKGRVWTVAIGRSYRAIARRFDNDLHWVWIGSHEDYNNILRKLR